MSITKVIFWDFDGVLMDSNKVRDFGFEVVLSSFPKNEVDRLLEFHRANGGLSRYVKFRYFFEVIRKETITSSEVQMWADRFSEIMKQRLVDYNLIIKDSFDFVQKSKGKYVMHITSGSDEIELRYLCKALNLDHHFTSINGSPRSKGEIIKNLIEINAYDKDACVLIGDSFNDFDAAKANGIEFYGYNSLDLKSVIANYIENFENFEF